jgi:hypothetical protein
MLIIALIATLVAFIVIALCCLLVYDPVRFFKILSLGRRPVPRMIHNPFIQALYRIVTVGIFAYSVHMIFHVVRP